jgi:hypothetical protein
MPLPRTARAAPPPPPPPRPLSPCHAHSLTDPCPSPPRLAAHPAVPRLRQRRRLRRRADRRRRQRHRPARDQAPGARSAAGAAWGPKMSASAFVRVHVLLSRTPAPWTCPASGALLRSNPTHSHPTPHHHPTQGKIEDLRARAVEVFAERSFNAGAAYSRHVGIGHTRWATHGARRGRGRACRPAGSWAARGPPNRGPHLYLTPRRPGPALPLPLPPGPPSAINSHPHVSGENGEFVVVHNVSRRRRRWGGVPYGGVCAAPHSRTTLPLGGAEPGPWPLPPFPRVSSPTTMCSSPSWWAGAKGVRWGGCEALWDQQITCTPAGVPPQPPPPLPPHLFPCAPARSSTARCL